MLARPAKTHKILAEFLYFPRQNADSEASWGPGFVYLRRFRSRFLLLLSWRS
jgi:hypothetical protein